MSHRVFAIASGKGGVGKSVSTVNVGAALAEDGHRVIVVDADLGMANLAGLLGVELDGPTLHELLAGDADLDAVTYTVNGFDLIPSAADLQGFAAANPGSLKEVVDALSDAYDYVILDVGAGLSHDTLVPLAVADGVILVSTPDRNSVVDTGKTKELTERLKGDILGVLLTRAGNRHDLDVDAVADLLGTPVLAVVPESDAVRASVHAGESVVTFAPADPASVGYRGLASMLERDEYGDAPVIPEPASEPDEGDGDVEAVGGGEAAVEVDAAADVDEAGEEAVDASVEEGAVDEELDESTADSMDAGAPEPDDDAGADDGVSVEADDDGSADETDGVAVAGDDGVVAEADDGVSFDDPVDDPSVDGAELGFEDEDALAEAVAGDDGEDGIAIEALDEEASETGSTAEDGDEADDGDATEDEDDSAEDDGEEKKGFFGRLFG